MQLIAFIIIIIIIRTDVVAVVSSLFTEALTTFEIHRNVTAMRRLVRNN